jgi:hypothetical protein
LSNGANHKLTNDFSFVAIKIENLFFRLGFEMENNNQSYLRLIADVL